MIVIGDHQPAAAVSGEGAPWDVPVHIIASRRQVLDRLMAQGFRAGLTPARPSLGPMQTLHHDAARRLREPRVPRRKSALGQSG